MHEIMCDKKRWKSFSSCKVDWSSASCPRTLQHVDWRNWASNHRTCSTLWAPAILVVSLLKVLYMIQTITIGNLDHWRQGYHVVLALWLTSLWPSWALFRLQANLFCFSNLTFNTDCPHCHLQVIRLDLWHPDITALHQYICMSYCGNDVGVSTCAHEQFYNTEVRQLEKWRYIIS